MQAKSLKFAIDINKPDDGVKKLLHEIKPTWKWDNVEQKALSGGYSCVMLRFFNKSDPDDSITVRIRDFLSDIADDQQKFEMKMLPILSQIGQFPTLLATFENGYCYEYVKGQPVVNLKTGEVILQDSILTAVAKKLVKLHTKKFADLDYSDSKFFVFFLNLLETSDYKPPNVRFPTKKQLKQECEYLKSFLDKLKAPISLCHGDLHLGNMVWNQQKETIMFVDWELVHIGYSYTDINHFIALVTTLWAENIQALTSNFDINTIPKDLPDKFCKYYYDEWLKHHDKGYVQEEFDSFKATVEIFKLCDSMIFLLIGLIFPADKTESLFADVTRFQERNLNLYLEVKKKYCGLDKFGCPDRQQLDLL